jgi:predicted ArsR family transcriptional regulator
MSKGSHPRLAVIKERIDALLKNRGPMSPKMIATAIGTPVSTVYAAIVVLKNDGRVVHRPRNR